MIVDRKIEARDVGKPHDTIPAQILEPKEIELEAIRDDYLQKQLLSRKQRLQTAESLHGDSAQLSLLLDEVDAALERMRVGTYGICESCHESIESGRLLTDPLVRICLDHLSDPERSALEQDLQLASGIQAALLPAKAKHFPGWEFAYHYQPAGLVSGDYCDLIPAGDHTQDFYFFLGDVSGKGVAASLLMSHLHAVFRGLIGSGLSLNEMVVRANRIFCESTMPESFATLVCGRASLSGRIEIINAGHLPALIVQDSRGKTISSTGLPLGLFCQQRYETEEVQLNSGGLVFAYTDGLAESRNPGGIEYGTERISSLIASQSALSPGQLIQSCLHDLSHFMSGTLPLDDISLIVLQHQ